MSTKIKSNVVTALPKQFFQNYRNITVIERNGNLVFIEALDAGTGAKQYESCFVRVDEYGKEYINTSVSTHDKARDKAFMKQQFDEMIITRDEAEVSKSKKADSIKQHNEQIRLNSLKVTEGRQLRITLTGELRQFVKEAKSMDQALKDKAVIKILLDLNNIEQLFKSGGIQ